ncbi:MAG: TIGR02186 family protein [Ahrensia sp.]|nr:TIGR02186 family protein [Ahrensia sp.]
MLRVTITVLFALVATKVTAEDLRIGLSDPAVSIESNFVGTQVAVFGSIENPEPLAIERDAYDIVVVMQGPPTQVRVRRKERRFGIWVNGAGQVFDNVPSFYTIASTGPLREVATEESLESLSLGFDKLDVSPLIDADTPRSEEELASFRASLNRLQVADDLFVEEIGGVEFLSDTLFRARLRVPANVPIGHHRARAFLFRDGEFLITRSVLLEVAKSGFEQQTYNLAQRNGLLYGIMAVFIAMATGWLASVVFRKD